MISVGPFPLQAVIVSGTLLLAWLVTRSLARHMAGEPYKLAGALLLDAFFWGLLGARLAWILLWWEEYSAAPVSMIAIGDGGFSWWAGVAVALGYVGWRSRARRVLRISVLTGVLSGVLAWFAAGAVIGLLQAPPMPNLALATLDEQPVTLGDYQGRPVVLNLWATWCPPCRREMPVLQQAQAQFPHISIVLVNQGEDARQVQGFLQQQGLELTDVLLDPFSRTMHEMGARALPTTLFFDAQGRLVDSHMGELTMGSFKSKIARHFPIPSPDTDKE